MGWTTQGFQPDNFDEIIRAYYLAFVGESEEYAGVSWERFKGSEEYRHFYAAAQVDMGLQIMFAGIANKMAAYLKEVNYKIGAPTTTHNEIVKGLRRDFAYIDAASMAQQTEADSGTTKLFIAFNVPTDQITDDMKAEIAKYLSTYNIVGGNVMIGDVVAFAPLDNGQPWPYKWTVGETDTTSYKWRFNIWVSRSSLDSTQDQDDITAIIQARYADKYSMGADLEPEKYWNLDEFAWAGDGLLEYSVDGGTTWSDAVTSPEDGKNIALTLTAADVFIRPAGQPIP